MRRLLPVTGSMIAVMLLVRSTSALAQTARPEQEANLWNRSPECIGAPVRDAPFTAEAVTVWHPSPNSGRAELQSIARYYRDRAGRVRVDFVGGMTPQRVLSHPTPTARWRISWTQSHGRSSRIRAKPSR